MGARRRGAAAASWWVAAAQVVCEVYSWSVGWGYGVMLLASEKPGAWPRGGLRPWWIGELLWDFAALTGILRR